MQSGWDWGQLLAIDFIFETDPRLRKYCSVATHGQKGRTDCAPDRRLRQRSLVPVHVRHAVVERLVEAVDRLVSRSIASSISIARVQVAAIGSVDGIATSDSVARQRDNKMPGPAGRLVDGIVRAEQLGTATEHGIAYGGIVDAGFFGVRVRTGAHQIALADEFGNVESRTVVAFQEGGVRLTGVRVGENDSTAQRWVAFQIDRGDRVLVHQKDDLPARAREGWPVTGEDCFVESVVGAADIIGSNHFAGLEDRADLCVQGVESARSEGLRFGEVELALGFSLLGFDEDEDRYVAWMSLRPLPDLLETSCERLAGAAIVDVLYVHDLEAGFAHDSAWVKIRVGW